MSANSIRAKVDTELARRVGTWFTVRDIQDRLNVNPATLKPLIMKYARENVLRRRLIKGTARSVEFSPAAGSITSFQSLLATTMPYRGRVVVTAKTTAKTSSKTAAPVRRPGKPAKKTTKVAPKKMVGKKKPVAKSSKSPKRGRR